MMLIMIMLIIAITPNITNSTSIRATATSILSGCLGHAVPDRRLGGLFGPGGASLL